MILLLKNWTSFNSAQRKRLVIAFRLFKTLFALYLRIDLRKLYQQNGSPVIKVVWDEITPNEAAAKNEIVTVKFELPNGEPAANYMVYV